MINNSSNKTSIIKIIFIIKISNKILTIITVSIIKIKWIITTTTTTTTTIWWIKINNKIITIRITSSKISKHLIIIKIIIMYIINKMNLHRVQRNINSNNNKIYSIIIKVEK